MSYTVQTDLWHVYPSRQLGQYLCQEHREDVNSLKQVIESQSLLREGLKEIKLKNV
jgi:hypothetical protein